MECNKDEATRAKAIAEAKLEKNDYVGAKKFASKAQSLYPGVDGISRMLATVDVYLSAENKILGEVDWYGVLGVNPSADDESIKRQYKKLALMVHPDKNSSSGADGAFKLISEAWSFLSDKTRRLKYNKRRDFLQITSGPSQPNVSRHTGGPSAPSRPSQQEVPRHTDGPSKPSRPTEQEVPRHTGGPSAPSRRLGQLNRKSRHILVGHQHRLGQVNMKSRNVLVGNQHRLGQLNRKSRDIPVAHQHRLGQLNRKSQDTLVAHHYRLGQVSRKSQDVLVAQQHRLGQLNRKFQDTLVSHQHRLGQVSRKSRDVLVAQQHLLGQLNWKSQDTLVSHQHRLGQVSRKSRDVLVAQQHRLGRVQLILVSPQHHPIMQAFQIQYSWIEVQKCPGNGLMLHPNRQLIHFGPLTPHQHRQGQVNRKSRDILVAHQQRQVNKKSQDILVPHQQRLGRVRLILVAHQRHLGPVNIKALSHQHHPVSVNPLLLHPSRTLILFGRPVINAAQSTRILKYISTAVFNVPNVKRYSWLYETVHQPNM